MFRKLHDAEDALTIYVDGVAVVAEPGESLAAVILRLDDPWSRLTPVSHSPRGPYCMMGVCFDCLARVDGRVSVQTCLTEVREGMHVERQTESRRIDPFSA